MFNVKALFVHALLALAFVLGAAPAMAGPIYRVTIDTSAFAGTSGFLDLTFIGLGNAAPATATLANFTGNFGAYSGTEGDVRGDLASGVVLGNGTGFNDFMQEVVFGGLFSFDVNFSLQGEGAGTTFGVALFDEAFSTFLGASGNVAEIALMPGEADVLMAVEGVAAIASVTAVPEPADWLLVMTGLGLMAVAAQRGRLRRG